MKPDKKIAVMSGISKRLFMALSDFRGTPPQLEDALFQMASVIDSTSKKYYPKEKSKKRFVKYLESVMTDIYLIATGGNYTFVNCHFYDRNKRKIFFGEIMYKIRCSSYHDPEEIDGLIHWGENNQIGHADGKFILNINLLQALFLILISDDKNQHAINKDLFNNNHFLIFKGKNYPYNQFIGSRQKLFEILGINKQE